MQENKKGYFRRSKIEILKLAKNLYGSTILKDIEDPLMPDPKDKNKERQLMCINSTVNKVMIHSRLGPGTYNNLSPSLSPSNSFSELPRFINTPEEKFAIRKMKTPTRSLNKEPELKKNVSFIGLKGKRAMRNIDIKVAREAKKIIHRQMMQKRIKEMMEKNKLPIRHKPKPSPSMTSYTWCKVLALMTYLGIFRSIFKPKWSTAVRPC